MALNTRNTYLNFLLKNKALHYPLFRRFLGFRLLLILGLQMQITIVSYMVYQLTDDVLALGKIGLFEAIPAIGLSLFSGHFVDNREKKGLLIGCTTGYIFLSLFFVVLALPAMHRAIGISSIELLLYVGVFINGILRSVFSPSSFSMLGLLLPRKLYPNGTAWSSTIWQSATVIGPLIGGVMLAWLGAAQGLSLAMLMMLTGFIILIGIPKQVVLRKTFEPALKSIATGMRYLFNKQILLSVLALDMFAVLFGGAEALLPVFAKDILHVGETGFGWLRAAPGIGSIITMFGISYLPIKTNAGKKLLWCIVGFGATTILFGVSINFYLSFFMLLLNGMFDAISVVIRGTILQLHTPDEMRGRISSINTMFISSSNELGAAESGITARYMGTVTAVVFGGAMSGLIALITYFKAPKLRDLNLSPPAVDRVP